MRPKFRKNRRSWRAYRRGALKAFGLRSRKRCRKFRRR